MSSALPPPISDGCTLCGMPNKVYRSLGIWASAAPAPATELSILIKSVTGVGEVGSPARVAGTVPRARANVANAFIFRATTVVVTVMGGGGGTGAAATVGAGAGGLASDAGTVGAGGATFDSDAGGSDSGSAVFDSVLGVVPASSPEFDPAVPVPSCFVAAVGLCLHRRGGALAVGRVVARRRRIGYVLAGFLHRPADCRKCWSARRSTACLGRRRWSHPGSRSGNCRCRHRRHRRPTRRLRCHRRGVRSRARRHPLRYANAS